MASDRVKKYVGELVDFLLASCVVICFVSLFVLLFMAFTGANGGIVLRVVFGSGMGCAGFFGVHMVLERLLGWEW